MNDLERRVSRLEASNRFLRWSMLGLLMTFVGTASFSVSLATDLNMQAPLSKLIQGPIYTTALHIVDKELTIKMHGSKWNMLDRHEDAVTIDKFGILVNSVTGLPTETNMIRPGSMEKRYFPRPGDDEVGELKK